MDGVRTLASPCQRLEILLVCVNRHPMPPDPVGIPGSQMLELSAGIGPIPGVRGMPVGLQGLKKWNSVSS